MGLPETDKTDFEADKRNIEIQGVLHLALVEVPL